jgi:hypothetical protein
MRKVLYIIGCIFFFIEVLFFAITFIAMIEAGDHNYPKWGFYHNRLLWPSIAINSVIFLVGTYLVTNNKPQE